MVRSHRPTSTLKGHTVPWFHYEESNYTSNDSTSILLSRFDHKDLIPFLFTRFDHKDLLPSTIFIVVKSQRNKLLLQYSELNKVRGRTLVSFDKIWRLLLASLMKSGGCSLKLVTVAPSFDASCNVSLMLMMML